MSKVADLTMTMNKANTILDPPQFSLSQQSLCFAFFPRHVPNAYDARAFNSSGCALTSNRIPLDSHTNDLRACI